MPSSPPTSLHLGEMLAELLMQVSCTVSSGAPDSSNWPPGSRLMMPPFGQSWR